MTDDAVILPSRNDELVRAVGREIIERGFRDGTSLFTPDRPVWNLETADELRRCYNEQPDLGSGTFLDKLRGQLESASDDAKQLAAELLTLQGLPLRNLTAGTFSTRITTVLSWMRRPVAVPEHVRAAFAQGTWNGGQGAHNNLWRWLVDAVQLTVDWFGTLPAGRDTVFENPWAWRAEIDRYPMMPSLRSTLLYLAFPTHFLPIINQDQKKAIRAAFGSAEPAGDLDRELFEITVRLQAEFGRPVDFYQPPFVGQWRHTPGRRAWLVRPRQGGPDLARRWRDDGFVSVPAEHLRTPPAPCSLADVRAAVENGYQHVDSAHRVTLVNEYHAFLNRMDSDDIVVTLVDDELYLGVIDGAAESDGIRLRRPVGWLTGPPTSASLLPGPLPAELDQQGTVVDLTGAIKVLTDLVDAASGESDPPLVAPAEEATLPPVTTRLAEDLHLDQSWLQELVDLLQERRQVILHGPPGTGKTYLARAVAGHVAERDAVRLVQFHPSYSYEDFFEGFRPVEGAAAGQVAFAKTPGPLRAIATEAKANPEQPYVLIVDEINRANLAKVFGELYFLLEYRKETVRLQYSPSEAFNLPPNVFIIGTMNTADRSIALVDAAIRRRFAFVELHPDEVPVKGLLARWANGRHGDRALLLDTLNAAIDEEDRDFRIGPSYLMRPGLDLERVWRHDLLPLLEEHYYGRLSRRQVHERFGLAAIRARLP